MAATFMEPGGDATEGASVPTNTWWSGAGGITVVSDFVRGKHRKSLKVVAGTYGSGPSTKTGVLADAGSRFSFALYIVSLPAATQSIADINGSGGIAFSLKITTGGVLRVVDSAGVQLGSDGPTLSLSRWYRISCAFTLTSTTVNRIEVFVDGASAISLTNVTLTRVGATSMRFGSNANATGMDYRYSDMYCDNSSSLLDPGDVWIAAKRPKANGTLNEFTTQIGSGGSGYGSGHAPQVNEQPVSATNGWSISTTTRKTEEYTLEALAEGDMDLSTATILDVMGWICTSVGSTANSPVHRLILNGALTAFTNATSQTCFIAFQGSATYPSGADAIGMDAQYTTTAQLTRLFECGVCIAFIPRGSFLPFMYGK